jgi:hypothetical protein
MARPVITNKADADIEVWEAATPSTTWVYVFDRREDRYVPTRISGRSGARRLHITRDDRKYNQELLPFENEKNDPFTNGTLRFLDAKTRDEMLDTRYHLTQEQLIAYFDVRDTDLFMEAVREIDSEIVLRRLLVLAPEYGTVNQVEALREHVRLKFPVGGSQLTVREMEGETRSAVDL